jgi:hypothetical protein
MKYIILIVTILLTGCNSGGSKEKQKPKFEKATNVIFQGQEEGCIAYYDELFCPPKYKKGILAADSNTTYVKDENGKFIILDKNNSEKYKDKKRYIKIPPKDK